jgi:orotate phosphoribosyltransferase
VIALDRRERASDERSAVDAVRERYGIPVLSIVDLDDLIGYLAEGGGLAEQLDAVRAYRARYGT